MALPALLLAGTALDIGAKIAAGSTERKAADLKATALRAQASRRLQKGQQEASALIAQGAANQTSEFASMLGKGVSRNASIVSQSLDEVMNRAKFSADQALSDAQYEAQAMQQDAGAISQQGREAQKIALIGSAGSLLGGYGGYLQGKYGKDAYDNFFGGKWS